MTCSLPPRQFLGSVSTGVVEVQEWAATSPSVAIRNTYGRNAAIGIGGNRVLKGVQGNEKDYELVGVYRFNQALKKYLEQKGIANAQEVANQLMLRCAIESTSTDVFSSIGRSLRQPLALSEVLNVENKPVIQPDQASVRFSVEGGKCIIERDFLMQYAPASERSRQYAWCVSRIEVDPNDLGDHWTETVSAKPYAEALVEEARRRVTQDKTLDEAIAEVKVAVGNQLKEFPGVEDLVAQIRVKV